MPVHNFSGDTFVAFIDISGFKELMKNDTKALKCLKQFYQAGYDALRNRENVEGFFVSDCGILFVRNGSTQEKLSDILSVIKEINRAMLDEDYMLTTSIAYGKFDYQDKLEFDGIEKNPIYGYAYIQAFLDNETGMPRIQPGQCRLVKKDLPQDINFGHTAFKLLISRVTDKDHMYYYWNIENAGQVSKFEEDYTDSYKLKFEGMLKALKG